VAPPRCTRRGGLHGALDRAVRLAPGSSPATGQEKAAHRNAPATPNRPSARGERQQRHPLQCWLKLESLPTLGRVLFFLLIAPTHPAKLAYYPRSLGNSNSGSSGSAAVCVRCLLMPPVIRTKIGRVWKLTVRRQLIDDARQIPGKLRKQIVLRRIRLP